jgi:hypothetical protein
MTWSAIIGCILPAVSTLPRRPGAGRSEVGPRTPSGSKARTSASTTSHHVPTRLCALHRPPHRISPRKRRSRLTAELNLPLRTLDARTHTDAWVGRAPPRFRRNSPSSTGPRGQPAPSARGSDTTRFYRWALRARRSSPPTLLSLHRVGSVRGGVDPSVERRHTSRHATGLEPQVLRPTALVRPRREFPGPESPPSPCPRCG